MNLNTKFMNSIEKKAAFKSALKEAVTMEEFLNICAIFYDFKEAKLNPISKITLIQNIDIVILLSNAKLK